MGEFAIDPAVGIDGLLSRQARRVLCAAGARKSFEQAEVILRELCGFRISDETIRQACRREGEKIQDWVDTEADAGRPFREAAGQVEFQTDAAKVNTDTGWRDIKIGVYAKREAGKPATPAEWDSRELPAPTARLAFAAIENCALFGEKMGAWARRLQVDAATAGVLGDGAEWIWEQTRQHLPGATEVLDIFHACEHLAEAGRVLHGDQTDKFHAWMEQARQGLLADGWYGVCALVGEALAQDNSALRQAALDEVVGYFSKQTERLNYCARLYGGRSIGSGMIEGACKTAIGQRLKQTGARWNVGNVGRMASLCCLIYNDAWHLYWQSA
jgi:hypothetical protein